MKNLKNNDFFLNMLPDNILECYYDILKQLNFIPEINKYELKSKENSLYFLNTFLLREIKISLSYNDLNKLYEILPEINLFRKNFIIKYILDNLENSLLEYLSKYDVNTPENRNSVILKLKSTLNEIKPITLDFNELKNHLFSICFSIKNLSFSETDSFELSQEYDYIPEMTDKIIEEFRG